MKKSRLLTIMILILLFTYFYACNPPEITPDPSTDVIGWDGNSITYKSADIRNFGSGTPAGMANYNQAQDTVAIWNTDASLDNYGGIQTPSLTLDFSKAVIFSMNVLSCYSQYIVKLAVEGESEYYYVLSDTGTAGTISINVVDSMLCQKYRTKNTQPDPGYANGWKYNNMKKNCSFHILAKGPDGEKQSAELVLSSISIYNNQTSVTDVEINSNSINNGILSALKGSNSVNLSSTILPDSVTDKGVLWSSLNNNIATISENGVVNFVGVGKTYIRATSKIDQSKSKSIIVDVLSGYENVNDLTARLDEFAYSGSNSNIDAFNDLFNTSWESDSNMSQEVNLSSIYATDNRISGNKITINNHFDSSNSTDISEANSNAVSSKAYLNMVLSGNGISVIYRNIDGKLFSEQYNGNIKIAYAENSGTWNKLPSYKEQAIAVYADGTVKKYEINVKSVTEIASYSASDLANTSLFTIPDRTKQNINPVIHALSPASLNLNGDVLTIKQNKYSEAKYCFGGIVSNVLDADSSKQLEINLDVVNLNQLNDYVKTMWEIKIIYYQADGTTVVSSNPLKIDANSTTGLQTIDFTPAYDNFRIYLVVNGSDIGAQFSDAEMQIRSLNIYTLD